MVRRVSEWRQRQHDLLRAGDDVVITGCNVQTLDATPEHFSACVPMSQIEFHPDGEVEAFLPPTSVLLTRGHRRRRGGC